MEHIVEVENSEKRLDSFLAKKLGVSRAKIKKLFEAGHITSEVPLRLDRIPADKSIVKIFIPAPTPLDLTPEDIALEILFEDEFLIVINKPVGMVVHPAPGHSKGTLVHALLHHCKDLKGVGDKLRPGIVHRLDKGTSGVMIAAKEEKTHQRLVNVFSEHDIQRKYLALCVGTPAHLKGTIESTIGRHKQDRKKMSSLSGGKEATTHYQVIKTLGDLSLIEFTLHTGRTHQIRVHASEILKTPLLCDPMYARVPRQLAKLRKNGWDLPHIESYEHPFLHAKILGLKHPQTNEDLYFETTPPQEFQDIQKILLETTL